MGSFDEVRRTWATEADDSPMACRLSIQGRVTLGELIDYFHDNHPEVTNTRVLELNFATAKWEDRPTADELAKRKAFRSRRVNNLEKWERETLARLKAKYE